MAKTKTTKKAAPKKSAYDASVAERVKAMAGWGLTDKEISFILQVSVDELQGLYLDELTQGIPMIKARMLQSVVKMALDPDKPNFAAAKEWLLRYGGWEKQASPVAYMSKKERQQQEAEVAIVGSDWENLLRQ